MAHPVQRFLFRLTTRPALKFPNRMHQRLMVTFLAGLVFGNSSPYRSIAERISLTEKFVYLQRSLKGGTAKTLIEGSSGTGEHYSKAIACLKGRYDRPRLIHQSHMKAILGTPSMKDGNRRELHRLHDLLQQHLRALNATESDELSQFITSVIQLKLDPDTLFEWQRHTQDVTEVPPFPKIQELIDLRAKASETTTQTSRQRELKPHQKEVWPPSSPILCQMVDDAWSVKQKDTRCTSVLDSRTCRMISNSILSEQIVSV